MKKIYKLPYLEKTCNFFNKMFADYEDELDFSSLVKGIYKNKKITKYIKSDLMKLSPRDWEKCYKIFRSLELEDLLIKEYFPLKYEYVISNFGELNIEGVKYRPSENKITWKAIESEKVFLKSLTDEEFKTHMKNICNQLVDKFNKKYLQFGGYFLLEKENLITDKNLINSKYRTFNFNPDEWIVI